MNITAITRIAEDTGPSNSGIRALAKSLLRNILVELKRRHSLAPESIPEMTEAEDRAARFIVKAFEASVAERAADNPAPLICLNDVPADHLRALLIADAIPLNEPEPLRIEAPASS
jgi:hypothetical protein